MEGCVTLDCAATQQVFSEVVCGGFRIGKSLIFFKESCEQRSQVCEKRQYLSLPFPCILSLCGYSAAANSTLGE